MATGAGYAFLALACFIVFQIVGLSLWFSRGCCIRLVTHAEIHTPEMIYGYDILLSLALPLLVLALSSKRRTRSPVFASAAIAGILFGIAAGVGVAYIGYGPVAQALPWLATGQNWFAKTAALYAGAVLALLGVTWAGSRRQIAAE